MRTFALFLLASMTLCACAKHEPALPADTSSPAAAVEITAIAEDAGADTNADAAPASPNLLALANGTIMPERYDGMLVTAPILMIDGSSSANWVSDGNRPQSFVFQLPQTATVRTLEFDNDTSGMGGLSSGIRELTVEVSDSSASDGYREIFAGTLEKGGNHQRFQIAHPLPGRWLRANFKSNHGGNYYSLAEIRAFGDMPPPPLVENVDGTYTSVWGSYNVTRNGTAITGCYQPDDKYTPPATFAGGLEGNIARVIYTEAGEPGEPDKSSPALLVFPRDGARLFFVRLLDSGDGLETFRDIDRSAPKAGICKDKEGNEAEAATLADEMEKDGRVTVYGINFDFNSASIRPESETVLQQVVDLLRGKSDLSITIEGHTDDVGGAAYNRTLSEKRANAVKDWLVQAGIDAARLQAEGKGADSPITSNATDIGRAQNRRVELVKR